MISNLEYLRAFYYVSQLSSITLASEKLYISQPAVSQSIKQLESDLGAKLFLRTAKGVKLTPEGQKLYFHVSRAFDEISKGEKLLAEMLNLESGEIRIGASDMTLKFYLLPYLEEFHRLYPKIKVLVSNAPTPETIASLRSGKIDFGIVSAPFELTADFEVSEVSQLNDIFVAGEKFAELKNRKIPLRELERLPIICLEKNTSTRRGTDEFLQKNGVSLSPEFELAQSDLIVKFAERNLGIGSVVDLFASESIDKGSLFKLDLEPPLPPRKICIIKSLRNPISQAGQKLLDILL